MCKLSDTSRAILSAERARLINLLPDTDPHSEIYVRLLNGLGDISDILYMDELRHVPVGITEPALEEEPVEEAPAKEAPKKTRKATKKEPQEEAAPKQEEPTVKNFTADEVKTVLADLVHAGKIVLPDLVSKYIPEGAELSFSNIPPEKYAALMEEAKSYAG